MVRTYVVTGAASGIGLKTKQMLEAKGFKVIGVDIHNTDVVADLSTKDGRLAAANKVMELSPIIDAVVACAGLAHPTPKTVSVNYFGVTEFLTAVQPALAKSSAPRVAITSSMASLMPADPALLDAMVKDDEAAALKRAQELVDIGGGIEGMIYGTTKRAVSRWIRRVCIRPEWAGAGIPVNAVGPGVVETPMTAEMIATEEAKSQMLKVVPMPLNGFMKPEAVADLLIWLSGESNTHTTGQTIYIDGGSDAAIRGENIWDLAK